MSELAGCFIQLSIMPLFSFVGQQTVWIPSLKRCNLVAQSVVRKSPETDWDVHHGNAAQHKFEDNPNILYILLRNACIFSGGLEEWAERVGSGHGVGFNIAWDDCGARDIEYLSAFTNVVFPMLYDYCLD